MKDNINTENQNDLDSHNETPNVGGWQEVIFSVRDLRSTADFYCEAGGWTASEIQELSEKQLKFWQLDNSAKGEELILSNPGDEMGYIRLVSFKNVKQRHIRSSSQSWDTGGIYDIDVRATDLENSFTKFQAAGWSAYNDPLEYDFGKFHITEALMRGPEDIVVAIIQRHKPKLEGYPNLRKLSHPFNSSQIVKDMDLAKDFYLKKLGFKIYMEHNVHGSDRGVNLFGVPHNIYNTIERNICILNPVGDNFGSIELVQLVGIDGNDFSEYAIPPNLGILALRFPVKNLPLYESQLRAKGVEILQSGKMNIHPYGNCYTIAIQSPEGAWLEFFEVDNQSSTG